MKKKAYLYIVMIVLLAGAAAVVATVYPGRETPESDVPGPDLENLGPYQKMALSGNVEERIKGVEGLLAQGEDGYDRLQQVYGDGAAFLRGWWSSVDRNPRNVLRRAVEMKLWRVAEMAIARGADPIKPYHSREERYYKTVLIEIAVMVNMDVRTARVLLDAGVDPDTAAGHPYETAPGRETDRPLHFAAAAGNVEMVRLLLDKGAKVDARDNTGKTALHFASTPRAARTLLEAGADPVAKDASGATPLETAQSPAVKELLRSRRDRKSGKNR